MMGWIIRIMRTISVDKDENDDDVNEDDNVDEGIDEEAVDDKLEVFGKPQIAVI